MNSILDDTCYYYMEKENIKNNAKCERLDGKIDSLYEKLDEEHKQIFNEMFDLHLQLMAEKEQLYFKAGFKFGLTLAMETTSL